MRKSSELAFKRPEVCRDSGGAETVIQNGVYNCIIALNVIVDGERKVRYTHAMMSVDDWMDARKAGQALERFVKALHEMRDNPIAAAHIEVLSLNEVEFGKGGKSNALHVNGRYRVRQGGLSLLPNRRRELYLLRKEPCVVRVRAHAKAGACSLLRMPQAPSRDNPLSGSSRRKSCCRSLARRVAWSSFLSVGRDYSIIPYRGGDGIPCGGGGIHHRTHRTAYRPTQNTQKALEMEARLSESSVYRRRRLQCVQWSRLLARVGFTTDSTDAAQAPTRISTDGESISVYLCPAKRASDLSVVKTL